MSHEAKIVRARALQALAVRRELDESEIQEAMEIVEKLTSTGELHGAAWAYDAIRRTYKRRKKARNTYLPLRHLERTANAMLKKQRLVLTPSRAPSEEVLGKKDRIDQGKVARLEKAIRVAKSEKAKT